MRRLSNAATPVAANAERVSDDDRATLAPAQPPKAPFNWRAHLRVHPAADLFPPMSEAELKELADDIKKNGLQQPIVVWYCRDTQIEQLIDGRNRLDALALLGWLGPHSKNNVNPSGRFAIRSNHKGGLVDLRDKFETLYDSLADDNAVQRYVIAANVHRRHLTAEQKRELIAKVLKAAASQSPRRRVGSMRP
jgi:hypothetical protein